MLQVVHTKTRVIQCMEKINKNKIPFRNEVLLAQQGGEGKKSNQAKSTSDSALGQSGKLPAPNDNFGMPQFTQHTHYSLRIQVKTHYHYSTLSEAKEVSGRDLTEQTSEVKIIMANTYIRKRL